MHVFPARSVLGGADWGRLASHVSAVNTFFYQRLTQRAEKRTRSSGGGELSPMAKRAAGYANVRRWSRRRDVFKLKYLFVPINETLHWSLASVAI